MFACLTTCARPAASFSDPDSPITGQWGGTNASLAVTPEGATLELPCAVGRIERPIRLDANGRFDIDGVYTPLRGIAPADDSAPVSQTVRFSGRVHEDEMSISIRFRDGESKVFLLKRGASATVPQCSETRIPTTERTI